jgi:inositol-phosphate phosphatase / L-galactose 1-phosphate phosphatase / histidinol-phosphatase
MSDEIAAYLALAERLADEAGKVALRYFRTPVAVDDKADASPVTIADREAELAMRRIIAETFPDHGVIGEEHGRDNAGASHVWVLDPIDGTKSFITGRPIWGTLISLCRDGRPLVGVIDCSALGERWTGTAGRPTLYRGRAGAGIARTRECPALDRAALYCTSPHMFDPAAEFQRFERVRQAVKLPLYGGDCYAYGLVASGYADLVIEAGLKVYDWAAIVPVLEGAGGRITDWAGKPLNLATATGQVVAAGDARTHDEALKRLTA